MTAAAKASNDDDGKSGNLLLFGIKFPLLQ